ncbi:MAG: hypothetical protein QNK05_25120 [Myxococcota bacterium]|nr:hypothetical protein [Myxococcota bacterium]
MLLGFLVLAPPVVGALLLAWLRWRPNRARIHPLLTDALLHWDVVSDGLHNAGTDLVAFEGGLLLAHACWETVPGSPRTCIRIRRSADGQTWEALAELSVPGERIGAPKLSLLGRRLVLHTETGRLGWGPGSRTLRSESVDGREWSPLEPVSPPGWRIGRARAVVGEPAWLAAGQDPARGRLLLVRSTDGARWEPQAEIHRGNGLGPGDIAVAADGRIWAAAGLFATSFDADAGSGVLLASSEPPHEEWKKARSAVSCLEGLVLFAHGERVFAIARHQPGHRGRATPLGGPLSRKRTALYEIRSDELVYLSDLPSGGDCGEGGVAIVDGVLWTAYPTNDIRRDPPLWLGRWLESDVRMARLPLDRLVYLADAMLD